MIATGFEKAQLTSLFFVLRPLVTRYRFIMMDKAAVALPPGEPESVHAVVAKTYRFMCTL